MTSDDNPYFFQILFEGRRAIGVEFTRNQTIQRVSARREVLVTAGTYGSAKLLMLSGVGPSKHLNSLKV